MVSRRRASVCGTPAFRGLSIDEMFSTIDTDQDGSISETESDAFLAKMEEGKKTQRPPFAPQAGQDWQAGLLTAMFANANRDEQQSATSMSLYV